MLGSTLKILGRAIRHKRRSLGLSQQDLAHASGISKPYISQIENGRARNPPSDQKLKILEQLLKFSNGELVAFGHLARTPADIRTVLHRLLNHHHPSSSNPLSPIHALHAEMQLPARYIPVDTPVSELRSAIEVANNL